MSQATTTSSTAERPSSLPNRPAVTTSSAPAAAPATAAPTRPALRVRYWEHMDPASNSLYPVD
ncbi:hypothetical protein [Hymenobacter sp. CRA2]|uniref:hypothetical protein n=1 Tax=Hymenobacter sp. CRA2 TaxID=1955620 RepID=UPI00098F48AF|nr:hypothetical protein [Hymenobacter sp. CRA2]OON67200.1 hypothetical protein B0919_18920 [Hymenobacter sp. CRA2]